jgi:YfiH family protein
MPNHNPAFIVPDWPAPSAVRAVITCRSQGASQPPFGQFNLAQHVGDDSKAVANNRQLLQHTLSLVEQPLWLNQVHGTEIAYVPDADPCPTADGSFSDQLNPACVVLTADCLPILLCNQLGTKVAAVHGGWRGLCGGIIGNALKYFDCTDTILAYLGPAISVAFFEVGPEVRAAFLTSAKDDVHRQAIAKAFVASVGDRYRADLYALAKAELRHFGVDHIYGGEFCSYAQSEQFYSYRRDQICGRNASMIWLV